MTDQQKVKIVRLMLTSFLISEYALIKLIGHEEQVLKNKMKNAINSCRIVQQHFINHPSTSPENKEIFKQQFLGDEIVLLTSLLEECFTIPEEDLERLLNSVIEAKRESLQSV